MHDKTCFTCKVKFKSKSWNTLYCPKHTSYRPKPPKALDTVLCCGYEGHPCTESFQTNNRQVKRCRECQSQHHRIDNIRRGRMYRDEEFVKMDSQPMQPRTYVTDRRGREVDSQRFALRFMLGYDLSR